MLKKMLLTLLLLTSSLVLDDVEQDLCLRYGADRVKVVSENPRIIKIKGSTTPLPEGKYDEPQGLLQAPLGLRCRICVRLRFGLKIIRYVRKIMWM